MLINLDSYEDAHKDHHILDYQNKSLIYKYRWNKSFIQSIITVLASIERLWSLTTIYRRFVTGGLQFGPNRSHHVMAHFLEVG